MGYPTHDHSRGLHEPLEPPEGFRCIFETTSSLPIASINLYAVTLEALVKVSGKQWNAPGQIISLQSKDYPSDVVIILKPFLDRLGRVQARNAHFEWALYRSVIAFNNPRNLRTLVARIIIGRQRVAEIEYSIRHRVSESEVAEFPTSVINNALATSFAVKSTSHEQLTNGMLPVAGVPFDVRWNTLIGGKTLRRETVFDTAAYVILWTGQQPRHRFMYSLETIKIPGNAMFFQIDPEPPHIGYAITVEMFADLVKAMVILLERNRRFCETYLELLTAKKKLVAIISLYEDGPGAFEGGVEILSRDSNTII